MEGQVVDAREGTHTNRPNRQIWRGEDASEGTGEGGRHHARYRCLRLDTRERVKASGLGQGQCGGGSAGLGTERRGAA